MLEQFRVLLITIALVMCLIVCYGVFMSMNEDSDYLPATSANATNRIPSDVVLVTAFIDIGDYNKSTDGFRRASEYIPWMKNWEKVANEVIFYTSSEIFLNHFLKLRSKHRLPTRAILLKTNDSDVFKSTNTPVINSSGIWSFSLLPNITKIFKRTGYPKYYPNTVVPLYSTVMNAKFDFLEMSISLYKGTRYFAWLDAGAFRLISAYPEGPCFQLVPPPGYDRKKIAMSEVCGFSSDSDAADIVSGNRVWVAGGTVFGFRDTLLRFIDQYRIAAERMIEKGWYSTDQQTIYSMYSDRSLGIPINVKIQPYHFPWSMISPYPASEWISVAYLMIKNGTCEK